MRRALALIATLFSFATPVVADGPVVVELYTSQGCSSCPPADALMHRLAERPDVIALALHVDYWDYIGWADSFAQPAHTARQKAYARVAGARSIYTPQMVIGGVDHVVGTKPIEVAGLIQNHGAQSTGASVNLDRVGNALRITGQSAQGFGVDAVVQLVRYTPEATVDIQRGENAGHQYHYANIVTDWTLVGVWNGRTALDITVAVSGNASVVVIVQDPAPGAVLASAVLR